VVLPKMADSDFILFCRHNNRLIHYASRL
jgi:hypothetical protein